MSEITADAIFNKLREIDPNLNFGPPLGYRWVLPTSTIDAIEKLQPDNPTLPRGSDIQLQLLGVPVRIDDSTEGLGFFERD